MTRYKRPEALDACEIEAEEITGGCAGGRPGYRLPGGISILMPAGTPLERIAPPVLPPIPPEPGPGAYLIIDVLCVRFPAAATRRRWILETCGPSNGCVQYEWAEAWEALGYPDVIPGPLVPAPPEVKLPWVGKSAYNTGLAVQLDHSGRRIAVVVGDSLVELDPDVAGTMAAAILTCARAAREGS